MLVGGLTDAVAERVLLRWCNGLLAARRRSVDNLETAFSDGVELCHILELLTSKKLGFHPAPTNNIKRTENISMALDMVSNGLGFKVYGLNQADIEAGNKKVIAGVIFQLLNRAYVGNIIAEVETLLVPRREVEAGTPKQKLLRIVNILLAPYQIATITNFDSNLQDGQALCMIIHRIRPDLIDLVTAMDRRPVDRVALAMEACAAHGVISLLDAEDVCSLQKQDEPLGVIYVATILSWLSKTPGLADVLAKSNREVDQQAAAEAIKTVAKSVVVAASITLETCADFIETASNSTERLPDAVPDLGPPEMAPRNATANSADDPIVTAIDAPGQSVLEAEESKTILLRPFSDATIPFVEPVEVPSLPTQSGPEPEHIDWALYSAIPANVKAMLGPLHGRFSPGELPALCAILQAEFARLARPTDSLTSAAFRAPIPPPITTTKTPSSLSPQAIAAKAAPPPPLLSPRSLSSSRASSVGRMSKAPSVEWVDINSPDKESTVAESTPDLSSSSASLARDEKAVEEVTTVITNIVRGARKVPIALVEDTVESMSEESEDEEEEILVQPRLRPTPASIKASNSRRSILLDAPLTSLPRATSQPNVVAPAKTFVVEDGSQAPSWLGAAESLELLQRPLLENPEFDSAWFSRFFLHHDPLLLLGHHETIGHFAVAVLQESVKNATSDGKSITIPYVQYRAMLFAKSGIHRVTVPMADEKSSVTIGQLLVILSPAFSKGSVELHLVTDHTTEGRIEALEQILSARTFKFGLLYVRQGQTVEEDMFANEGSAALDAFMDHIGTKVTLNGWSRFRGGLDVKDNRTGTQSLYTEFNGYEIMFHVSTLLPGNAADRQQLERKRHIGNDICTIVFVEGQGDEIMTTFAPDAISSHFLHVFVVVRPFRDANGDMAYFVNVASKESVHQFGPLLSNPPIFKPSELRDFLLTKLINGEMATYTAPTFRDKLMRTLGGQLELLWTEATNFKVVRKNTSLASFMTTRSHRPPLQLLATVPARTNKIASATTALRDIPHMPSGGASWNGGFILGSTKGLYFFDGNAMVEIITAKRRRFTSVVVAPELGLLVSSCVRIGGHPYVVVFELDSIKQHLEQKTPVTEKKLDETRNLSHFAVDQSAADPHMVVAVKRRLFVWSFSSSTRTFTVRSTFTLPDEPKVLALRKGNVVVATVNKTFFMDATSGDMRPIDVPSSSVEPLSVIQIEREFILTFSNACVFVDLDGQISRPFTVQWNTFAHSVAYAFPYIVGLMRDAVEVRSLLNGRLLQALPLQSTCILQDATRPLSSPILVGASPDNFTQYGAQIHRISLSDM